jgi:hypothetical protein
MDTKGKLDSVYDYEDAAEFIFNTISEALAQKLTFDNILFLVELKHTYVNAFNRSVGVDMIVVNKAYKSFFNDELSYYIRNKAAHHNIILSVNEYNEFKNADDLYTDLFCLFEVDSKLVSN